MLFVFKIFKMAANIKSKYFLKIQKWKDFNGNGYLQGVRHATPYDDHFGLLWRPFWFWIQNGRQITKILRFGQNLVSKLSRSCSCELIIVIVFGIGSHGVGWCPLLLCNGNSSYYSYSYYSYYSSSTHFCPLDFSEMPWSNFMKPWRNIICHVKLWF